MKLLVIVLFLCILAISIIADTQDESIIISGGYYSNYPDSDSYVDYSSGGFSPYGDEGQFYSYGSESSSIVINGQPIPYGQGSMQANTLWIQSGNQQMQYMQCSELNQIKLVAYSMGGPAIMTEVYPDGHSIQNHYYFQPGYNEIIFAPDVPGRHTLGYEVYGQLSNVIILDVAGQGQSGGYPITGEQYGQGQGSVSGQEREFEVGPGESIQAAIDAANPGDTVWVKPGTYYEHININKPIFLEGWVEVETKPETYPIVDASGKGSAITISADGAVVESFKVMNSVDSGMKVLSNDNIITQIVAENNFYGIYLENSNNNSIGTCFPENNQYGIYMVSSNKNKFDGLRSEYNIFAFYFKQSNDNRLYDEHIFNNTYGIYLDSSNNNEIPNAWIADNSYGYYLINSFDNKISGNTLCDNSIYNAYDNGLNQWYVWSNTFSRYEGNFYGTCHCCEGNGSCNSRCPWEGCWSGAPHIDSCDNPYYIPGGQNVDKYPYTIGGHYCGWASKHKKHK